MQPLLQQDKENGGQHPNINWDPCTHTQTFPAFPDNRPAAESIFCSCVACQIAILGGNEDLADMAAELAAMLTLAESSTPLRAQSLNKITPSIEVMHCQDGTEAVSA